MVQMIGWKRLEVNNLIKFLSIAERNFMSVWRRAFVWEPQGRFVDGKIIKDKYQDADQDGIFPMDPDLGVFLVSGPAIAAGLRYSLHRSSAGQSELAKQIALMNMFGILVPNTRLRRGVGV